MSARRKPKNLDRYVPAAEAAIGLREVADQIEKNDAGLLISWYLTINRYDPPKPAQEVTP